MRRFAALIVMSVPVAAPAVAQEARNFQIPGGPLSANIAALSKQGGISISVAEAGLWTIEVRPVNGRMSVDRALARLLSRTGARAVRLTATSWRIEPAARAQSRPKRGGDHSPASRNAAVRHQVADPADDIIVTASKADLPASHYAGTATLIGHEQLGFGGERGTESLLRHAGTLSSTHLGAGRNKLFIRGIADSSFTGPTQSTVGQYLGDIRLSYNAPDPDLRLYDLDGVEVVEGPQGTLYGAGSLGGIIRLVPSAPNPDVSEYQAIAGVSLTQHGQPGGDIAAIINMPIAQNHHGGGHALRLVGYMISDGGYIDNPLLGQKDVNRTRVRGTRASLRLQPSQIFTIHVGGIYQHIQSDDAQYADRGSDDLSRKSFVVQPASARYAMASLVLTRELGDLELQSSNAYIRHKLSERFDASLTTATPRAMNQHNDTRMWVSETRLSRPFFEGFGWVAGLSYIDNRAEQRREDRMLALRLPRTGVSNHVQEFTGYGTITAAITPRLIATGGIRLSHSRLSGEGKDVAAPILSAMAWRSITANRKQTDILPAASLLYSATENLRFYASYGQGFRPGGLAISDDYVRRFQHDRVKTWEAGVRFADHHRAPVQASLSLSHSHWRDIQADYIDASGFPSTENIGDGRITSLSAFIIYRATPELTLEAGGLYNHSRVQSQIRPLGGAGGNGHAGSLAPERLGQIPNVARYMLRTSAIYAVPLGRRDLRINGWAQYIGPSRLGIGPILGEAQGNYLDSGLALRYGDEHRGLSLTLTNPLDVRGNRFALGTPFNDFSQGFTTPLRPRSLRLAVDISY